MKKCSVDGCERKYDAKGYCKKHYDRFKRNGDPSLKNEQHGLSESLEYKSWAKIKQRCLNPNDKRYESYGARGITVCERWKNSFLSFLEDMGPRPSKEHSIDRINVNGNYEPSNCRWADIITQNRNKRVGKLSKSRCKGVNWDSKIKKWRVYIYISKKRISLGYFKTLEDAIKARKEGELKYW